MAKAPPSLNELSGENGVMYDLGTFKMYVLIWGDSSVANMLAVEV